MTEPVKPPRSAGLLALGVGVTDPRTLALLDEAARVADRLDELDRIIAGKGVLNLMQFRIPHAFESEPGGEVTVEVKFDNVLAEARQQASVLRALLVTLGVERLAGAKKGGGSILDQLAARRAAREAEAAGQQPTALDV